MFGITATAVHTETSFGRSSQTLIHCHGLPKPSATSKKQLPTTCAKTLSGKRIIRGHLRGLGINLQRTFINLSQPTRSALEISLPLFTSGSLVHEWVALQLPCLLLKSKLQRFQHGLGINIRFSAVQREKMRTEIGREAKRGGGAAGPTLVRGKRRKKRACNTRGNPASTTKSTFVGARKTRKEGPTPPGQPPKHKKEGGGKPQPRKNHSQGSLPKMDFRVSGGKPEMKKILQRILPTNVGLDKQHG